METNLDLHIHSNLSDGVLNPKEIIDTAKNNNAYTIAISDHDTLEAYTKETIEYATFQGITLIKAVEISAKKDKIGVHILGYNIDIKNEQLLKTLARLKNSRKIYLNKVAKKINDLGYILNIEKLKEIEIVTKAHIARDIIDNELNKDQLMKTFSHIPNMGEYIETIMNENCPAYVEKESITPSDAAKIIRDAGGQVILAHPVAYKYEDNLSDEQVIELIKEINADGIEANYIYIDKDNKIIDECEKWNKIANELKILKTIGSDYHKTDNLHPEIGFPNNLNIYKNIEMNKLNKIIKPSNK